MKEKQPSVPNESGSECRAEQSSSSLARRKNGRTDRQTDLQTVGWMDKQTDKQAGRQADGMTDRHIQYFLDNKTTKGCEESWS